jgi:hypothetical protein
MVCDSDTELLQYNTESLRVLSLSLKLILWWRCSKVCKNSISWAQSLHISVLFLHQLHHGSLSGQVSTMSLWKNVPTFFFSCSFLALGEYSTTMLADIATHAMRLSHQLRTSILLHVHCESCTRYVFS